MNRILHTNLYTPRALQILKREILVSADSLIRNVCMQDDLRQAPNGEVVLEIKDVDRLVWPSAAAEEIVGMSDSELLNWLALSLKERVLSENLKWEVGNCSVLHFSSAKDLISITVQELHLLHDVLSGQEGWESRYPEDLREALQGYERDPLATELEILIEERRKQFLADWRQRSLNFWVTGHKDVELFHRQKQLANAALDLELQDLRQKIKVDKI